jgi:cytoskeletal protein CcmA (bactofilin family)
MTMNDPKTQTADERRVAAWIGKAVRVEGKVISSEDLTIDGDVEGSIEVGDRNLTIGVGAAVKADLLGRSIIISGSVKGDVKAVEKIELHSSGSVEGDITAPRFAMADGATVTGKVKAGP